MIPIMRTEHDKWEHDSHVELGTVISASPLVISLDLERLIQLEFDKGDFVMPDNVILYNGDRVCLTKLYNRNLYAVLFRIRGTFSRAVVGDPALALGVARIGDLVAGTISGSGTDPQGGTVTITGTFSGAITTGSAKVKVE
jgi:hypothetical protein